MIDGISSTGKYIIAGGGNNLPYISPNSSNPMQGMVRVNNNYLEAYNGGGWQSLSSGYAQVGLTPAAEEAIDWVIKHREEMARIEALDTDHPAVKIAKENIARAKEAMKTAQEEVANAEKQLKATLILSKEYENSTS
jgi:regulator of protease activity HflC (stomatin/prohibitin superfamily)